MVPSVDTCNHHNSLPSLPTDPDMQEIGNFNGPDPLRTDEENTHWGCVGDLPLLYLTCGLTA